jgi:hypothetical protein
MSTKTIKPASVALPKVVNTVELEQRKSEAKDKVLNGYYKTTQFSGYYVHPAADEPVSFNNVDQFLAYVGEMAVKGILLYPHVQPVITGSLFQLCYYKPQDQIDALVAIAETEAEQAYRDEIESFNQQQVNLLAQQLVDNELNKESKKEEARIEAIKAKALITAQQHIQSQLKEI